MRVLVCGGRAYGMKYEERQFIDHVLTIRNNGQHKISCIIQGGAQGADAHAKDWAKRKGVPVEQYEADWVAHGIKAGPIRNTLMLKQKIDLVLAFKGGRGTMDLVKKAKAAGLAVIEYLE